jgi:hypothetical protein
VAVDAAGVAYVAWIGVANASTSTNNTVDYCVLPPGATACSHSGLLAPVGGNIDNLNQVQAVVDGSTTVLLGAVAFDSDTTNKTEPVVEWTSTDGGATFTPANGGNSVADLPENGPLNALVVPGPNGSNPLGYAWTANGLSNSGLNFEQWPLTSPPTCSYSPSSAPAGTPPMCPFATLGIQRAGNLFGLPGTFASELTANPGILGVLSGGGSPCATGNPSNAGSFVYGSGAQAAGNDYNTSPGSAGSAWKLGVTSFPACQILGPAVGGGPSGFGVMDYSSLTRSTEYRAFNQSTDTFAAPVTISTSDDELGGSVSQDASGKIYVTYQNGSGSTAPIRLALSKDGGTTWTGPVTINPATSSTAPGGVDVPTGAVGADGQGWEAWAGNGTIYAQQFNAADAVPPRAETVAAVARVSGRRIELGVTCTVSPCQGRITITFGAPAPSGAARDAKLVTIASGKYSASSPGTQQVAVRLTGPGRRLLAQHHGHLTASVVISNALPAGSAPTVSTIKIRP